MKTNKLLIAAAGSGKTRLIVNQALEIHDHNVLITTYTEENERKIRQRVIDKKGYVPSNIFIQTWFSFLLQHGVRPYQSILNESIHYSNIGFYLINEKSGRKYNSSGKPIFINGKPIYWGEEENLIKHYFTNNLEIYSDKLSKYVVNTNEKSYNLVIDRISRIYKYIFIDEVQDLAGYDLEILKLFFKSTMSILMVGDPRQVTYLTHHSQKHKKYSNGLIKDFIKNELGNKIHCKVDETTLNVSHRNNQQICNYSSRLYKNFSIPTACTCSDCRKKNIIHEGVFLVKPQDVNEYLAIYNPVQLRWSLSRKNINPNYEIMNFGESKGSEFDRVLIFPTKPMESWVKNNNNALTDEARAKLYVGITRARHSVGIVVDDSTGYTYNGVEPFKYK